MAQGYDRFKVNCHPSEGSRMNQDFLVGALCASLLWLAVFGVGLLAIRKHQPHRRDYGRCHVNHLCTPPERLRVPRPIVRQPIPGFRR